MRSRFFVRLYKSDAGGRLTRKARQGFLTQSAAKYAEKTCANSYWNSFLNGSTGTLSQTLLPFRSPKRKRKGHLFRLRRFFFSSSPSSLHIKPRSNISFQLRRHLKLLRDPRVPRRSLPTTRKSKMPDLPITHLTFHLVKQPVPLRIVH